MIHTSKNEEETKKIAQDFAKTLKGGEVVFLHGDLGAGKTTFVRGVAEDFGFDKPVRSPTFTIVNRYNVDRDTIKQIMHVDLYRIEDPEELVPLALDEEFAQPDTIAFVEWPEKDQMLSLKPTHNIRFEQNGTDREIEIQ